MLITPPAVRDNYTFVTIMIYLLNIWMSYDWFAAAPCDRPTVSASVFTHRARGSEAHKNTALNFGCFVSWQQ